MEMESSVNLSLTESAARQVKQLLARDHKDDHALRVAVTDGGCSGFSYQLSFDKEQKPQDIVIESGGVKVYIDSSSEDATAVLQRMGGARAILASGTSGAAMGTLVSGLGAHGKLIVVGVPQDQIQLNAFPLVFGGRSIYGSLTGTPIDGEDTLAFSVLENIRPMIETVPLEQAAEAYARMMQGKARFRMVLVTKNGAAQNAGQPG